ncbi:MAG: FIST C-terminal domain-containing protein [Deltaproteobacteria bacterium]|jgi:hypothetical protein|nr:FIST C-terminal domain-containing protein [Deltaproteobacteria bacterium]
MLKAKTGSSVNADAAKAGAEAAGKVKAGLASPKVAFVYSGVQYDQKKLLAAIASGLPGVPLVGNTSFTGVITDEGFISSDDGFVGILAVGGDDLAVGVAGLAKAAGGARETGRLVARAALAKAGRKSTGKIEPPDFFYMAAPPGEEETYLKGISDVIGRVPVFGGSAADNEIAGKWLLYADETVTADGLAVAFFYSSGGFANIFTGAYDETTNSGVITKIRGRRTLVEIDGVPAIKKYSEWTGHPLDKLSGFNLLVTTITGPLGVKDRLGELVAIRHPMNGNDDLSMEIGADLAVNTAVIQMSGSVDKLIASAASTVKELKAKLGGPPAALHLVHCGGRRAGIGDRVGEIVKSIKAEAGDVPFIVEFTFGEYGHEDDGNNTTGGLMLSYTALS